MGVDRQTNTPTHRHTDTPNTRDEHRRTTGTRTKVRGVTCNPRRRCWGVGVVGVPACAVGVVGCLATWHSDNRYFCTTRCEFVTKNENCCIAPRFQSGMDTTVRDVAGGSPRTVRAPATPGDRHGGEVSLPVPLLQITSVIRDSSSRRRSSENTPRSVVFVF